MHTQAGGALSHTQSKLYPYARGEQKRNIFHPCRQRKRDAHSHAAAPLTIVAVAERQPHLISLSLLNNSQIGLCAAASIPGVLKWVDDSLYVQTAAVFANFKLQALSNKLSQIRIHESRNEGFVFYRGHSILIKCWRRRQRGKKRI